MFLNALNEPSIILITKVGKDHRRKLHIIIFVEVGCKCLQQNINRFSTVINQKDNMSYSNEVLSLRYKLVSAEVLIGIALNILIVEICPINNIESSNHEY